MEDMLFDCPVELGVAVLHEANILVHPRVEFFSIVSPHGRSHSQENHAQNNEDWNGTVEHDVPYLWETYPGYCATIILLQQARFSRMDMAAQVKHTCQAMRAVSEHSGAYLNTLYERAQKAACGKGHSQTIELEKMGDLPRNLDTWKRVI
jgi:hypothetical protein